MKMELATIINGLIGKELSTVDKWIYEIVAQILIDICDGFEDSTVSVTSKLSKKEVKEILDFLHSAGFTCKVTQSDFQLIFYTYWGEEED